MRNTAFIILKTWQESLPEMKEPEIGKGKEKRGKTKVCRFCVGFAVIYFLKLYSLGVFNFIRAPYFLNKTSPLG